MVPSFSGYPAILGEICSYLQQHELSRMLRVDQQTYQIAGRQLYRHLIIRDRHPLPFPTLDPRSARKRVAGSQSRRPWNRLLNYVEILDISETTLSSISQAYVLLRQEFPSLRALETLVLRAQLGEPRWSARQVMEPFGEGLQPSLLVFVGGFASLFRVMCYRREGVSHTNIQPSAMLGQLHQLWPSVHRLHHIIPHQEPDPYPTDFIVQQPDCDIDASLPNLLQYDLFFDYGKIARYIGWDYTSDRTESHFLRSIAWAIRNSRPDLPLTIWLAHDAQPSFAKRKGFLKQMIRQPYTRGARTEDSWNAARFTGWGDLRLAKRLGHVQARLCGVERDRNWCGVADRKMPYDPTLLGRTDPRGGEEGKQGRAAGETEGDILMVDWDEVKAEDDREEVNFGDEETDAESYFNSEEDYY